MASKLELKKMKFAALVALIFIAAVAANKIFGNPSLQNYIGSAGPLIGVAFIILLVAITYKLGEEMMKSEKKPEKKDVFDYTTKDTSVKVLGRLAELKYGERKRRDKFDDYYSVGKK